MGLTAAAYREQLQALLPQGRAWSRSPDATVTHYLDAAAEEYARVHARADALVDESIPTSTNEMLVDWEGVAGLPDNCSGTLRDTLQGRRADLVSKLVSSGGQSREYYTRVAASLGFEVEIEEFKPFRAGRSVAGDRVSNGDWKFTWRVRSAEVTVTHFRAGRSAAGEPIARWGNDALECRIQGVKPAHTQLQFAYGGLLGGGALLLEQGGPVLNQDGTSILLRDPST
ncbi:YmfQ family protein [Luteimonas soli]|uniref:YmfQ family protein n=1 Tax=Luteimonas soli TaxID=1648966 RepID=A0ABV7XMM0_9GAMM